MSRGEQAADEVARRWMAAMQSMGDQLLRQQQTFQQMSSYVQLLNTPPFYVSRQLQQEGQRATGQALQQASEQWMALAQKQQQTCQQMFQQWMEQAQSQQQAFQQVVQKSLGAYADLSKPPPV